MIHTLETIVKISEIFYTFSFVNLTQKIYGKNLQKVFLLNYDYLKAKKWVNTDNISTHLI